MITTSCWKPHFANSIVNKLPSEKYDLVSTNYRVKVRHQKWHALSVRKVVKVRPGRSTYGKRKESSKKEEAQKVLLHASHTRLQTPVVPPCIPGICVPTKHLGSMTSCDIKTIDVTEKVLRVIF